MTADLRSFTQQQRLEIVDFMVDVLCSAGNQIIDRGGEPVDVINQAELLLLLNDRRNGVLANRAIQHKPEPKLSKNVIMGMMHYLAYGRWGSCSECPQHNATSQPMITECKHTDRYDHNLGIRQLLNQISAEIGHL